MITSGEATAENFSKTRGEILDLIKAAVDERVDLIQIREKQLPPRSVFELASEAANIMFYSDTQLLISEFAGIAMATYAHGVQLPVTSSTKQVRANVPEMVIGASVHTAEDAVKVASEGADFALYGPVFDTPGKGPAVGVEALGEVCRTVHPFPVIAVGGINKDNYQEVIGAGASGFAAIRALNDIASLRAICRALKK
jgi:thiamine-phosphate pyrophosphorylase